jgi:hypothetical protein
MTRPLKTHARRFALAVSFIILSFGAMAPTTWAQQCPPNDCLTAVTPTTTALTTPVADARDTRTIVQVPHAAERHMVRRAVNARAACRDRR